MSLYLIGDLQGCDEPLQRLLDTIAFSPSRDTLYFLGDLVNRGPASHAVLRRLMGYGDAARCILGNHDLHLLAAGLGRQRVFRSDTIDTILQASDRDALLDWLRQHPLARHEVIHGRPLLMVHAGVLPGWTVAQTLALADEVHAVLRSNDTADFYRQLYGQLPDVWHDGLQGMDRLRLIINALTRMRYCSADGVLLLDQDGPPDSAPAGYLPWFDVPGRRSADTTIAFGHWSALGWLQRDDVWSLDTGCLWGGCLSALRVDGVDATGAWQTELIQVKCPQTRAPLSAT